MTKTTSLGPNRIVLVTGGSSGIGLATAKLLAEFGCHVWLAARREELLQVALKVLEASAVSTEQRFGYSAADLSDVDQAPQVISQVKQALGAPHLLVNAAGIVEPGCFTDLSLDDFHRQMEVNFYATLYMVKAVLPGMLERGAGTIVNIASLAAVLGIFGYTAYGASKYAVRGFSEALRAELKPLGIHVMLVFPPDTDTPQLAYDIQTKPPETKALAGNMHVMSPDEVAHEILKGIQRQRASVIPGLEGKLLYRLSGLLGDAVYPIMDILIARAQHKQNLSSNDGDKK